MSAPRLTLERVNGKQEYKGTWDGKRITVRWHFAGGFTVYRHGKPNYYARIRHFPAFYVPERLAEMLAPKLAEFWQEPADA